MWTKLLLVLAVLAGSNAQNATQVSQCIQNQGPLPIFTSVHGCITPPCLLPQQQDVVLDIIFQPTQTIRTLRTVVTAYMTIPIVGEVGIPYDLGENSVTCNFLVNSYCPVLLGEVIQYQLRMFIESFFPVGTAVTLEFRVVDADIPTHIVSCIRVPIRIEPPVSNAVQET